MCNQIALSIAKLSCIIKHTGCRTKFWSLYHEDCSSCYIPCRKGKWKFGSLVCRAFRMASVIQRTATTGWPWLAQISPSSRLFPTGLLLQLSCCHTSHQLPLERTVCTCMHFFISRQVLRHEAWSAHNCLWEWIGMSQTDLPHKACTISWPVHAWQISAHCCGSLAILSHPSRQDCIWVSDLVHICSTSA